MFKLGSVRALDIAERRISLHDTGRDEVVQLHSVNTTPL